ncbi:MAG: FAD-dependent oxidoreductase [Verrucomicrobiota bacterium]|nr:FAD-dependent oxidoreductase [Verrucomicrobiota bacterium]
MPSLMPGDAIIELDVVILGGGFAGVYCARELAGRCRKDPSFRVGLISAENYMVFQPMLAEVAAASLSPRHVVNPIRMLCRGIRVMKGTVHKIDPEARIVYVEAGDFTPSVLVRYKQLVVCLGAKVDLSRVPGMPEHALLMQNVGDAMKLRSTVISRFEEANLATDPVLKRRLLSFIVVGGGYSGVETAGELHDLMVDMGKFYENIAPNEFQVTLVHSQEHLLPTLNTKLGNYAREKLEARGLKIILNRRAKAVTAHSLLLDDGTLLEATTVISTIGNSPHPTVIRLAEHLALKTEKGRIITDATMHVPGHLWLWAAGDCAAIPLGSSEAGYCPATAQFAMRQGAVLARNILAERDGGIACRFTFTGLGEMAAIGHRTAVAQILGITFSGFFAWFLWRTVYLSKLPGFQRKLHVMVDWTFDLIFPRDINLLNPQYTRKLREMHLEPGDILFNPGEPAFSLYFVKEGLIEIRDGTNVVKTIFAGDYFGERALLEDGIWRYQAVACQASSLIALGAPEFKALVEGSSALKRLFTRSAQAYLSTQDVQALKNQLSAHTLSKCAAQLMNSNLDVLTPDSTLRSALSLFKAKRHGSYPLVDSCGKLLGMIKRDDLFDYLKSHPASDSKTVMVLPHELSLPMTGTGTGCAEIVEIFLRSGRNKLLIVNREQQLLGILTLLDLAEDSSRVDVAE